MQALLSSLPTKPDLSSLVMEIKKAFREDVEEIKQSVQATQADINSLQALTTQHKSNLQSIKTTQPSMQADLCGMQLCLEGAENRSRRNNIHLREIPEFIMGLKLCSTVTAILNLTLGKETSEHLELDRVHGVQHPLSLDITRPRDTVQSTLLHSERRNNATGMEKLTFSPLVSWNFI